MGNKTETKRLYEVAGDNSGMNRIMEADALLPFTEIKIRKMDEFTREHGIDRIDLIKIDVEDFELNVLGGAAQTLQSFPKLFIEPDDNNLRLHNFNSVMLLNHLMNAGYNRFHRAETLEAITEESDFTNCHFDLIAEKIL